MLIYELQNSGAKTGEVYEYYELVGDSWYHIRLSDGSEAYVYKEYVDVLN